MHIEQGSQSLGRVFAKPQVQDLDQRLGLGQGVGALRNTCCGGNLKPELP